MSTKQPVSPSGEDILELLEATTAPEQRLSDHLHAPQLLRWSLCSGTWRAQLARSPAWRRLARWRFGEQLELILGGDSWGVQLEVFTRSCWWINEESHGPLALKT